MLKTSVEEIDEKFRPETESNALLLVVPDFNIFGAKKEYKKKLFQKYTQEFEIGDLD